MKENTITGVDLPKNWYNIIPDLPDKLQIPINPHTRKSVSFEDLNKIFPAPLIEQEMSDKVEIKIPEKVLDVLSLWRPTPLIRAKRLEERLKTPAKIYYKYEGVSPAGSHKLNTAVAQAYYNKISGLDKLITETGAGQWGSALAFACKMFDMSCRVFMVKISYEQKPYRRSFMRLFDAEVIASPSNFTVSGKTILQDNPDSNGSLGIAISEAVEEAANDKKTNYSLGSVLNHVLLHQTVIGLEAKKQLETFGDYPDKIFACCGGGSNFGGIALPFIRDKIYGKQIDTIAVEPSACPTLTKGVYTYDYGDTEKLTPILKMFTLGHNFEPPAIHAGGLRYHGVSPLLSYLYDKGLMLAQSVFQSEVYNAGKIFAQTEGIIPAPESAHAIAAIIKEADKCKKENISETLLFCLSGHGYFDMGFYDAHLDGKLDDFEYSQEAVNKSLKNLPEVELK
jgi:tryptophan synthase beta chain